MKTKTLGDFKLYAVKVDSYVYDETKEDGIGIKPTYFGLEGELEILIFEENISNHTRIFESESEANDWIKSHNTGLNVGYENPRAVCLISGKDIN